MFQKMSMPGSGNLLSLIAAGTIVLQFLFEFRQIPEEHRGLTIDEVMRDVNGRLFSEQHDSVRRDLPIPHRIKSASKKREPDAGGAQSLRILRLGIMLLKLKTQQPFYSRQV